MKITIKTIDHSDQRYPTVGDWWWDEDGNLHVAVSKLPDWSMEALVGLHEVIEALLCRQDEVTTKEVDNFDIGWEPWDDITEPGDDPAAPYYQQHQFATGIERLLAARLNIHWPAYERAIESLD